METTPISKLARRLAVVTLLLLLAPLAAMQFTEEVNWGPGDFVIAGLLLFGAGMLYILASARVTGRRQRAAVAAAVMAGLAIVWAELAVGLFR
jgi:peptidoglycan/LPS O-acetylase OafA/YrhL